MASSEIYLKEVVVVTTIPTNKANLGEVILKVIEKKTFPKDTTFYVVCGFHTKVRSDLLSYFIHTTLNVIGSFDVKKMYTHQIFHWISLLQFFFLQKNGPNNVSYA